MSDENIDNLLGKLQKKRDLSKLSKDDYVQLRSMRRERLGPDDLATGATNFKTREHYDLTVPMHRDRQVSP